MAANNSKKIRIGWFTFSCCGDSTMVMIEIMNECWEEWKKLFDFRHFRVLKSNNVLDNLDIAFVEGAIASDEHSKELKEIREKSKYLVAIGACAVTGMPAGQRNTFNEKQKEEIQYLIDRFKQLPKVLKISDVVKVDVKVPGCPMDPDDFLEKLNSLVERVQGSSPK